MSIRFIIILLFSFGIIISCERYNAHITIKDISRDSVILVNSTSRNPSVLVLKVTGNIDSDVKINSISIPKGNVNKKIILDSYSQIAQIKYEHGSARFGKLLIKYKY